MITTNLENGWVSLFQMFQLFHCFFQLTPWCHFTRLWLGFGTVLLLNCFRPSITSFIFRDVHGRDGFDVSFMSR